MHGCCLGDDLGAVPGVTRIPWGHLGADGLGDDASEFDTQISTLDTAVLGEPGGILAPDSPITVADLANYAQTGNADPSIVSQLSTLINAAGPAVSQILQQVQLGQISSSSPLSQSPVLRAAIVSGGSIGSSLNTAFASVTSNPLLLIGVGVLAFMFLKKK
jgi:hypothetical protein